MAETIKVLVSEEEVNERIKTLGKQISENYAGKQIHMICVLKGGVFFMCSIDLCFYVLTISHRFSFFILPVV